MEKSLTLLYTHGLRGEFGYLPRLHTVIQGWRLALGGGVLLVDCGLSCAPEVWHCEATGGRSMLLALDAMGYHAARVDEMAVVERDKLRGMVSLGLVDAETSWRYHVPPIRDDGIVVASELTAALRLCVILTPCDRTYVDVEQRALYLSVLDGHEIGMVRVMVDPYLEITAQERRGVAEATVDWTIASVLELIEDEARRVQQD